MRIFRYTLILFLIGYLLTGVAQIRPEERAVVKRFGRIVARPGPGLWIGLPWGIDRIDRIPIATVRRINLGYRPDAEESSPMPAGQLLTGDQNLVNVQVALDYAVGEGDRALEDYVLHRDRVEPTLTREAETLLAEWVAGRSVDDVLLTGNAELPRFLIRRVQERIEPLRLGVRVQQASLVSLTPLEEVRSAFEEVNRAQTNIRTQEFRARQEGEQKLQAARSEQYRLEQEAISYADRQTTQARAEAESFGKRLASYRRLRSTNPNLLNSIWWDEMGQTLIGMKGRGRLDLLDHHLGTNGLDISQFVAPGKRR